MPESASSRRWRLANPEKMKLARKRWELAHPEQRRASKARWDRKHPEVHRKARQRWRKKHPEQERQMRINHRKRWVAELRPGYVRWLAKSGGISPESQRVKTRIHRSKHVFQLLATASAIKP